MKHIVYQTTNLVNGKIYIGVSNGKNKNYLGSGQFLKKAIAKYGWDSFKRETLFECDDGDEAYWIETIIVNKEFIKFHDCYNARIGKTSGYFNTDETCERISNALIGNTPSLDTREKISESVKKLWEDSEYREKMDNAIANRKLPPPTSQTKEKIRQTLLGHKHSKESRRKMSKNHPGCEPVVMFINNNPLFIFHSIKEAVRVTGYNESSIIDVAKGRTKTTGQWINEKYIKVTWKYKKESD